MQPCPHVGGEAAVGRLLGDRVLELVLRIEVVGAPWRQVELGEVVEVAPHLLRAAGRGVGRRDPSGPELPSDHTGDLDRRLLALAQLIDAGHHQALEAGGQVKGGQRPTVVRVHALGVQEADQLLQIEGVAFAALSEPADHLRRQARVGAVHPAPALTHQPLGVRDGQLAQVDLGEPVELGQRRERRGMRI